MWIPVGLILLPSLLLAADVPQPSLRSESSMVLINATVVNGRGQLVTDLDAQRFDVQDETRSVRISHFVLEESPVSTVVLLDLSGSMKYNLQRVVAALRRFADSREAGDDFCILTFAGRVASQCQFTTDPHEVLTALSEQGARGDTPLLDAFVAALRKVEEAPNRRRALLLLTDSIDNASRTTWQQARLAAQEFSGTAYAVVPPLSDAESLIDEKRLQDLVEITGGRMLRLGRFADLDPTLESLDLRRQYVLGYGLPDTLRDGKYHRVRIRLKPANNPEHLRVFWRRGYVASPR